MVWGGVATGGMVYHPMGWYPQDPLGLWGIPPVPWYHHPMGWCVPTTVATEVRSPTTYSSPDELHMESEYVPSLASNTTYHTMGCIHHGWYHLLYHHYLWVVWYGGAVVCVAGEGGGVVSSP